MMDNLKYWLWLNIGQSIWYPVRNFFRPQHKEVRASIPRHWVDSDYLIIFTNFAIITSFVENEMNGINGVSDYIKLLKAETKIKNHKGVEFNKWLIGAYNYIKFERPNLEEQLGAAYPKFTTWEDWKNDKTPYHIKYGEVNRLNKIIQDKDTEVLKAMIDWREYMWT